MGGKRSYKKIKHEDVPPIVVASLKGMECPVCLQIPRENIFQCSNGHSICDQCTTQVATCPTCQSPGLPTIRNYFAEHLLNSIKFPCMWTEHGCQETMLRGQLSAHQNLCDDNPDIVKFCSKFPESRNCQNKFTPKWLTDSINFTLFKNHVLSCFTPPVRFYEVQYRVSFPVYMNFKYIFGKKFSSSTLAHHSYTPSFYQLPHVNKIGRVQVLALFVLLKCDAEGNRHLSFAWVQLTPEEEKSKIMVKIKIDGNPSSNMVSDYGSNSLPPQIWSQKPVGLMKFLELVENPHTNGLENGGVPSYPFSIPVSFLADYYASKEDKNKLVIECTVELVS